MRCLTDRIASYEYVLDFVPFMDAYFERLETLLPWDQTGIGANNIEPLTT